MAHSFWDGMAARRHLDGPYLIAGPSGKAVKREADVTKSTP